MKSTVHAGAFELTGITGVSLARAKDALGIRLVFIHESLGIFDGKNIPLSLAAPPIQAPDLSYASFEVNIPVTHEGIRKYSGWPRQRVNGPCTFNYSPGEAATVKIEWSFDGKTLQGRYSSNLQARFAIIVNGCFEPAQVIESGPTDCILKLRETVLRTRFAGTVEPPVVFDTYSQLDRAWSGLPVPAGSRSLAYPATIGPDNPLLFSMTLEGESVIPNAAMLDSSASNYDNTRMRSTGALAGQAEAVASVAAYSRAYDPVRQKIQTSALRTWGDVNEPGHLAGWDNFFMSYLAAWENPELGAQSLEHIVGTYGENGIGNGPTQRNLIIPVIYCRLLELTGNWDLARRTWPTMMEFMRFFPENRDGNGDGLIELGTSDNGENELPGRIIQNAMDETGYDELPVYSAGFTDTHSGLLAKGVRFDWKTYCLTITTVCQNSLYIAACRAMEAFAKRLGHNEDAAWLESEARRIAGRMNDLLYDPEQGIFRDRYWEGGFSPVKAMTLFFPLLAGIADERGKKVLHEILTDPKQFWGENLIPTVSRDDPSYCDGIDRQGNYWRGNCWPPTTYMVYLSAKEAGWDSTVAEYGKRASAEFMQYWLDHTHFYENYPAYGKVRHDFLYVTMWGGRESHHCWSTLQLLCALEEIFGFELDGSLRFGNPYLETQSSWKNFIYRGHRVEAETGPEKTSVNVEGQWHFNSSNGVSVRNFEHSEKGHFSFTITALREATITVSPVTDKAAILLNNSSHPLQRTGNAIAFNIPAGRSTIAIA